MGLSFQRKNLPSAWVAFRWCRIVVWFAIFLVVAAVAYLHLVGLPDILKPPLLEKIRQRGFEAKFTSARLSWGPAIVIENAAFYPTNRSSGPRLSAGLTEVKLNWNALLHRRVKADSVVVENAQVKIPVANRYGDFLSLTKAHLTMQLSSNDVAQLSDFEAEFRGIKIRVDGEVTNFASITTWKWPARWYEPGPSTTNQARPAVTVIDQLHFANNTRLDIHFSADGHDINTLRAEAILTAPEAETPWGSTGGFQLRAAAAHLLDFTNRPFMQARVIADGFTNRWGTSGKVSLTAAFFPDSSTPFNALLNFAVADVEGMWNSPSGPAWVRASRLSWQGEAALSPRNFRPTALDGTLRVSEAASRWGSVGAFSVGLKAERLDPPVSVNTNWGIWTRFSPYSCLCHFVATNIQSPQLRFDSLAMDAKWRAPRLSVEKLEGRLYEGHLGGSAALDVDSRQLSLHAGADFDPHAISQVLTPAAQRWLSQFTWRKPPIVNAEIRLILPAWTNRNADWRDDVRSSVQIAGDFSVGSASFRKIEADSAKGRFFYSNRVWNLPRLHATRPDGSVELDYTGNAATHEYHLVLDSRLDPADALPWVPPEHRRLLGELHFTSPPQAHVEVTGLWHDPESAGFAAILGASNFTVWGQSVDQFNAHFQYTNHLLSVSGLRLSQGDGRLEVPLASADLESKRITLTNAQSTLDPKTLLAELGTNAPEFLKLIQFDVPPTVRASGSFVLGNPQATDMKFHIQGSGFHWTNLVADKISGGVQWLARNVSLTNIEARVYNTGRLKGWLSFDYAPGKAPAFRSDFSVKNIDLGLLARGLSGKTNRLGGILDGYMAINAPVTANKDTWTGHGDVHIHDALLWDIKIFGVLSPLLNSISPRLGDSRASEASALFYVNGGKVSTDDLEVRATGVRLFYRGYVTMNKQVNGRVEADVLRDTPVFGPILSTAFMPLSKLFEYEITGSMERPVFKPLFVPKILMLFLRPFHTLKELMPESPTNTPTNAPPSTTTNAPSIIPIVAPTNLPSIAPTNSPTKASQ